MADDKVKVNVSTTGVEVEAQGGAASRLGHALVDALSPFTETMGLAGDTVKISRVLRQIKAIETLKRAKEIQDELGIDAHPVSPKLLTSIIEGASLEPDGEESLTELWANLLANASENFSSLHALCADLLTKLGAFDAQILQKICINNSEVNLDDYSFSLYDAIGTFKKDHAELIQIVLKRVCPTKIYTDDFLNKEDVIKKEIQGQLSLPGSSIIGLSFYPCESIHFGNYNSIFKFDDGFFKLFGQEKVLNSLDILSHHGLIDFSTHVFDIHDILEDSNLSAFVTGVNFTSMGAQFASACIP
ncbi:MAG: hypothetical protein ABJZ62_02345, partial [Hyphomicrobiales bacterium]